MFDVTESKLTMAIIGFGGMGCQHARTIRGVSDLRLSGVYDVDESRQKYARESGYFVYGSIEEILRDSTIDLVLIATPNHLHKDISIRCLKAGKHVICEKPAMLNAKELQEVLAVSCLHQRVFTVHQNRRWDEDFNIVRNTLSEGSLGRITCIESRVMGSQGIPGDWRREKRYGGGMLLDWGVHLADQLLSLIPEKIARVYCKLGYLLGGECDDSVKLFIEFESGCQALVEVETWNMERLPRWYVVGKGGAMTIQDFWLNHKSITCLKEDIMNNTKPVDAGKGITKTMAPRDPNTLETRELEHIKTDVREYYQNVIDVIRGKAELIVKPEQTLRVMRLIDRAFESAALDQVLDFETAN